jgi:hypothetical protein
MASRWNYGLKVVAAFGLILGALAQSKALAQSGPSGPDAAGRTGAVRRASADQSGSQRVQSGQPNSSGPQQPASGNGREQAEVSEVLAGYYGGYADGYLDGLEDAVYYMIDLHHQRQYGQTSGSSPRDEQMREHREGMRDRMRRLHNSTDGAGSSADTQRLSGRILDHWVARRGGQQHQFVEIETSRGSRCDVDLGLRSELGSAPIRQDGQIAVRGQFNDSNTDQPVFVARQVWLHGDEGLNVNAAQAGNSQPRTNQ